MCWLLCSLSLLVSQNVALPWSWEYVHDGPNTVRWSFVIIALQWDSFPSDTWKEASMLQLWVKTACGQRQLINKSRFERITENQYKNSKALLYRKGCRNSPPIYALTIMGTNKVTLLSNLIWAKFCLICYLNWLDQFIHSLNIEHQLSVMYCVQHLGNVNEQKERACLGFSNQLSTAIPQVTNNRK